MNSNFGLKTRVKSRFNPVIMWHQGSTVISWITLTTFNHLPKKKTHQQCHSNLGLPSIKLKSHPAVVGKKLKPKQQHVAERVHETSEDRMTAGIEVDDRPDGDGKHRVVHEQVVGHEGGRLAEGQQEALEGVEELRHEVEVG
jgi:hypothetical protein